MTKPYTSKMPSLDEINALIGPVDNEECQSLCRELNALWDERQNASDPAEIRRLNAGIRAVASQMKRMHCVCLPE